MTKKFVLFGLGVLMAGVVAGCNPSAQTIDASGIDTSANGDIAPSTPAGTDTVIPPADNGTTDTQTPDGPTPPAQPPDPTGNGSDQGWSVVCTTDTNGVDHCELVKGQVHCNIQNPDICYIVDPGPNNGGPIVANPLPVDGNTVATVDPTPPPPQPVHPGLAPQPVGGLENADPVDDGPQGGSSGGSKLPGTGPGTHASLF